MASNGAWRTGPARGAGRTPSAPTRRSTRRNTARGRWPAMCAAVAEGGRPPHRTLHLAPPVRLPRACADRRPPGPARDHDAGGEPAPCDRRPDRAHVLRSDHRSRVRGLRRPERRCRGRGGRPGRTTRRDQRDRSRGDLHHQCLARPRRLPGRHREGDRPREGGDHQAGRPSPHERNRTARTAPAEGPGEAGRSSLVRAGSGRRRARP